MENNNTTSIPPLYTGGFPNTPLTSYHQHKTSAAAYVPEHQHSQAQAQAQTPSGRTTVHHHHYHSGGAEGVMHHHGHNQLTPGAYRGCVAAPRVEANIVPVPLLARYPALIQCPGCREISATSTKHVVGKGTQ